MSLPPQALSFRDTSTRDELLGKYNLLVLRMRQDEKYWKNKIDTLQAQNDQLENKMERLKAENQELDGTLRRFVQQIQILENEKQQLQNLLQQQQAVVLDTGSNPSFDTDLDYSTALVHRFNNGSNGGRKKRSKKMSGGRKKRSKKMSGGRKKRSKRRSRK